MGLRGGAFEDAAPTARHATLAACSLADSLPGDGGFYRNPGPAKLGHEAIIELTGGESAVLSG